MSIIYDALKKLERNQKTSVDASSAASSTSGGKKTYFIYAVSLVAGVLVAFLIFTLFKTLLVPKTQATATVVPAKPIIAASQTVSSAVPEASQAALPAKGPVSGLGGAQTVQQTSASPSVTSPVALTEQLPQLELNGIFYSPNQSYALINNRIVSEGDAIKGAVVKKITQEGVELEFDGKNITLRSK